MSRLDRAYDDLMRLDALAARATDRRDAAALSPDAGRRRWRLETLDERALLLTTALYLVFLLSHGRHVVAGLLPFALYPAVLAGAGHLSWRWMARQCLRVLPVVALIGIWNPWLEPGVVRVPGGIVVAAGWATFAGLLLRMLLSVAAALALLGALGWPGLLRALGGLGVPAAIRTQGALLYRHLFGLFSTARTMAMARELRGGGRLPLREWGPFCGQLLLRTLGKGERVEQALACRGFTGEWPSLHAARWRISDSCWTLGWLAFFAAARWGGWVPGLGAALGL